MPTEDNTVGVKKQLDNEETNLSSMAVMSLPVSKQCEAPCLKSEDSTVRHHAMNLSSVG